jgi:methionyl-tRNA formyltransferase
MRLVFAGTPAFAAASLQALIAAGHQIVLVLTQPDRQAGRGMKLTPSEVKQVALAHGLEVFQPQTLRDAAAQARLRSSSADAMVVAAYGLILPPAVLGAFPLGCINVHASLLPRWRGAAPIQRALLAGDTETGVCIMAMEAGLDTGPVFLERRLPIEAGDTAGSLHDKLASLGAEALVQALPGIAAGTLASRPQPTEGVTYAAKISKEEAGIDWRLDAPSIERRVRAFNPFPGCHTTLRSEPLKVWRAACAGGQGAPGQVLRADEAGIVVACGRDALRLDELQRAGGKRVDAAQFVRGTAIGTNDVLGH